MRMSVFPYLKRSGLLFGTMRLTRDTYSGWESSSAMGEFLALLTALLWAVGVILFKRSVNLVTPFALNLFKTCIAFVLLLVTAVGLGQTLAVSIAAKDLLVMVTSGAVGIGVSDMLFFMTLARLGASRTALV